MRFQGLGLDEHGEQIALGEWLVIASRDELASLEQLGYVMTAVQTLDGLDRVLAQMEAPRSFDIEKAQAVIRGAAPQAEVDYNHLYHTQATASSPSAAAGSPHALYPELKIGMGAPPRIGVIDTGADTTHAALRNAHIQQQDFVSYAGVRPQRHGTAVASILVGSAPDYLGLLPGADVYLASVFFTTPDGSDTATTVSLVRALDWMIRNRVPVVSMSLAGPKNTILESAIDRAYALGSVVVAAVGNQGPVAKPLYPAAYDHVIAVTAVNSTRRIYRLANRGAQVDFSAPGVNVLHASIGAGFETSSGTSMATPFVAAVVATSCPQAAALSSCLRALENNTSDLGAAGFDPVFGYGFIRPLDGAALTGLPGKL